MRRSTVLTVLTATTAFTAACGGSGANGGQATVQAGATPAVSQDQAADAKGDTAAAGVPQMTVTEQDTGNDGENSTLPKGMPADKAADAGMGSDGAPVISVTNTDTSCIPDKTTVAAGKVWVKVTNDGTKITEMYLESEDGEELIEIENVTPGDAGAFTTTVKEGTYLLACEPGMSDTQIRTPLEVTAGS